MGRFQKTGPMRYSDYLRVIQADGWTLSRSEGSHRHFQHSSKRGTVSLDENWSEGRVGDWVFRNVTSAAGLSKREFLDLYWSSRGKSKKRR